MALTRVVHVSTGLDGGGAEGVLVRLCMESAAQTIGVISLGAPSHYSDQLARAGLPVFHLGMPRGRLTLNGVASLYGLLRKLQPEVVQTWMYHGDLVGGLIARLSGCKTVVWNIRHSDLDTDVSSKRTRLVARLCARLSRVIPRRIIVCAARAADAHAAMGYDQSKFDLVPNGYDTERFCPDPAARAALRHALGWNEDTFVIGLIGRWHPQKDHRNLFSAIRHLPASGNVGVLLAGQGCDENNPALLSLVEEFGMEGRVRLLGRRDDVPALMNALDVHALVSSHGEAFPNVVAEAMSCGTPCIVTDVGDAALIVGSTGWVVPARAPTALAAAIEHAMEERGNISLWTSRKASARARIVENFTLARMVAKYQEVWTGAAARRKRGECGLPS